jgi:hypothetical protein
MPGETGRVAGSPQFPMSDARIEGAPRARNSGDRESPQGDGWSRRPPAKLAFFALPEAGLAEASAGAAVEGGGLLLGGGLLVGGGVVLGAYKAGQEREKHEARVGEAMVALYGPTNPDRSPEYQGKEDQSKLSAARAYVLVMDMFAVRARKPDAATQDLVAREVAGQVQRRPWLFGAMLKRPGAGSKLQEVFLNAEAKAPAGDLELSGTPAMAAEKPWNVRNGRVVVFELPEGVDPDTNPPDGIDLETGRSFWYLVGLSPNAPAGAWAIKRGAKQGSNSVLVFPGGGGKGELKIALQDLPVTGQRAHAIAELISQGFRLREGGYDVELARDGLSVRVGDDYKPVLHRTMPESDLATSPESDLAASIESTLLSGNTKFLYFFDLPAQSVKSWDGALSRIPSDLASKYRGIRNLDKVFPATYDFLFLGQDGIVHTRLTSNFIWSRGDQPRDWTKVRD